MASMCCLIIRTAASRLLIPLDFSAGLPRAATGCRGLPQAVQRNGGVNTRQETKRALEKVDKKRGTTNKQTCHEEAQHRRAPKDLYMLVVTDRLPYRLVTTVRVRLHACKAALAVAIFGCTMYNRRRRGASSESASWHAVGMLRVSQLRCTNDDGVKMS